MNIWLLNRAVAVIVALAAAAAFIVLFLLPDQTHSLFSWAISPWMTAREMGAGYLAGVYLSARVALGADWPSVRAPVLALTVFSIVTLAATLLHLDRFHHGTLPFYVWTGLYAFLAIALPLLYLANERAPRILPFVSAWPVSRLVQKVAAVVGVGALVLAAALFLLPDQMAAIWPWQITPLTARALSAWYFAAGTIGLALSTIVEWRNWRRALESGSIVLVTLLVGVVLSWPDFDPARPLTWAYIGGTVASLAGIVALYVTTERRLRRGSAAAA